MPETTRTHGLAAWIGWHAGELVAVLLPAGLAAGYDAPWLLTLSAGAGLGWAGVEARAARRRMNRALPAEQSRDEITTHAEPDEQHTEQEARA